MLLSGGMEPLGDLVQNGSLPWPVADIYQLSGLSPPMTRWYHPGSDEWWERKVRLAPRTLSVVTGHTRGHGRPRWFNVVKRYEVDLTDEERAAADARPTGQRWSGFSRRLRSSSRGPDRARRSL
jgi:hypothetical protein